MLKQKIYFAFAKKIQLRLVGETILTFYAVYGE